MPHLNDLERQHQLDQLKGRCNNREIVYQLKGTQQNGCKLKCTYKECEKYGAVSVDTLICQFNNKNLSESNTKDKMTACTIISRLGKLGVG